MPGKHDEVVFQIMPDLGDASIRKRVAQGGDHLLERQLAALVVPDRDVIALAFLDRQGDPHQAGGHLIGGGGLGVEGDDGGRLQRPAELFQAGRGVNHQRGQS